MMRSFTRMGAATYITVVRWSLAMSGVDRAPYSPCSARRTSRHCEWSLPVSRPSESKTTRPSRSVTAARSSTRVLRKPKMSASKRRAYSAWNSGPRASACSVPSTDWCSTSVAMSWAVSTSDSSALSR